MKKLVTQGHRVAAKCGHLRTEINKLPSSRERSIMLTKLDEILLWTTALVGGNLSEIERQAQQAVQTDEEKNPS